MNNNDKKVCLSCNEELLSFSPEIDKKFLLDKTKVCRECFNIIDHSQDHSQRYTRQTLELCVLCSKCGKEEYVCYGCKHARIACDIILIRNPDETNLYFLKSFQDSKLRFKEELIRKFFLRNGLFHMRYVFETLTSSKSMPPSMVKVKTAFYKNEEPALEELLCDSRDNFKGVRYSYQNWISIMHGLLDIWEGESVVCQMNSWDIDDHVHYGYIDGYAIMRL